MKKLAVIPFASRIHGERYYSQLYEELKRLFSKAGAGVEVLPVVTNGEEVYELARSRGNVLPIFVALTGGVSGLMRKLATLANYNRVILFGHGEHNSLPSAISARSKLELEGIGTWLFHCKQVSATECLTEVQCMVRVAIAVASLLNSKILLVGSYEGKPESAEDFESYFEARVDVLPLRDFVSKLESASGEYVERFMSAFERAEFRVPRDRLVDVARVYSVVLSLIEANGYDAVAIDCFPYLVEHRVTPCLALALLNAEGVVTACEGDLAALALMLISRALVGKSGWIANASAFNGELAYFAHCTIALNTIQNPVVVSHFESGYPYSLFGKLGRGTYTAASLSPDFTLMTVAHGHLVESGLLYETMCRMQAVLNLGFKVHDAPVVAASNHHVLIPGDARNELRAVATLLGLDYVEYKDLVYTH